jgi:hypothetical protein
MSARKHLIHRYLLAALVGFVIGCVGIFVKYLDFYGMCCDVWSSDLCGSYGNFYVHRDFPPANRTAGSLLLKEGVFLTTLVDGISGPLLLDSTLLIPFAVYTFDVVAASRRRDVICRYALTAMRSGLLAITCLYLCAYFTDCMPDLACSYAVHSCCFNDLLKDHHLFSFLFYGCDAISRSLGFVIGIPALTLFELWNADRRSQQKPSACKQQ